MASKFELTISTKYVPDWTYIEAFRELFQNAIDNETENPENKMDFEFTGDTIKISNKTSILEIESLLLGNTTKSNSINTIGKHGEGYKIAFMVLLREGKRIKVYNYGKREIWEARLVKSKRFNGELIPTIFVEKEAIWKRTPNSNLIIEVSGVTGDEFREIRQKNLNLQEGVKEVIIPDYGSILTDTEKEAGNVYVRGLFICNNKELKYGYNFEPSKISLDRDRKLVDTFNLVWTTSAMWKLAYFNNGLKDEFIKIVNECVKDVAYIKENMFYDLKSSDIELLLSNDLAKRFIEEHGPHVLPVSNNEELKEAKELGMEAVIVTPTVKHYITNSTEIKLEVSINKLKISEKMEVLLGKIESKLSDEELEEFESLIEQVKSLE